MVQRQMGEFGKDWISMDEFQGTAGKVCSRYKKAYRAAQASVKPRPFSCLSKNSKEKK